jgi:hypothetical protein
MRKQQPQPGWQFALSHASLSTENIAIWPWFTLLTLFTFKVGILRDIKLFSRFYDARHCSLSLFSISSLSTSAESGSKHQQIKFSRREKKKYINVPIEDVANVSFGNNRTLSIFRLGKSFSGEIV